MRMFGRRKLPLSHGSGSHTDESVLLADRCKGQGGSAAPSGDARKNAAPPPNVTIEQGAARSAETKIDIDARDLSRETRIDFPVGLRKTWFP